MMNTQTNTNTEAHRTYSQLRGAKSRDRAAWLSCAALCRAAAALEVSDDTASALLDRAESAEMNARRLG